MFFGHSNLADHCMPPPNRTIRVLLLPQWATQEIITTIINPGLGYLLLHLHWCLSCIGVHSHVPSLHWCSFTGAFLSIVLYCVLCIGFWVFYSSQFEFLGLVIIWVLNFVTILRTQKVFWWIFSSFLTPVTTVTTVTTNFVTNIM